MRYDSVVACHRSDDKLVVIETMTGVLMASLEQLLGTVTARTNVLSALTALRELRDHLDALEPELIAAARADGASWADLAPVLGVASRQAAERRYLRLRRPRTDETGLTGDERVLAERDRRAGERAVDAWAKANGADLRQLAGQISALTGLGPDAQPSLDRLHHALGDPDATALPELLAGTEAHLPAGLANRVRAVGEQIDEVRSNTHRERTSHRRPAEFADGSS
jgi:hypothetical protein